MSATATSATRPGLPKPAQTSWVEARGMVGVVNKQMPFVYANRLGFNPKTTYHFVREKGFRRVKQVFDFYVSIWEDAGEEFFWFAADGSLDGSERDPAARTEAAKKRFCRYIKSALEKDQKLITEFAGRRYFNEGWADPEDKVTEGAPRWRD